MTQDQAILENEDTQHGRYLTFAIDAETFGIEIQFVTEIIGMQSITKLPEVPGYIKGIINLRGKIIPVVDVRLKFKKQPVEYTDRTCIVVIENQEITVGLIVDNVSEVVFIEDENVVPPPDKKTGAANRYIKGIGKVGSDVKLLLDCDELFGEDETKEIQEINN